jgi:hypothetical protein
MYDYRQLWGFSGDGNTRGRRTVQAVRGELLGWAGHELRIQAVCSFTSAFDLVKVGSPWHCWPCIAI